LGSVISDSTLRYCSKKREAGLDSAACPTALPDLKMLDEQKTKQDRSGSNKDRDHIYQILRGDRCDGS
jgi:hypothetical protein